MVPVMTEMVNMNIRRVVAYGQKTATYMADDNVRGVAEPCFCLTQMIGSADLRRTRDA
jgi:hypothetical protein